MADYTEEQRVKQVYPDAFTFRYAEKWQICSASRLPIIPRRRIMDYVCVSAEDLPSEQEAWADASYKLGNEFVDEVGPLAERKEG